MSDDRILVVDDDEALRFMMVTHLKRRGYDVESAADGISGLQMMQNKGPFSVLITDLMMPNMNGLRLLREARQMDPWLQVIVITAAASISSAISAMRENGAYDYLTKPLEDISELSMAVARALVFRQLQLERVELQARLQSEAERLRLLIANIGDAILAADGLGLLTVVNPAAARLLGRDDLVGKEAQSVLPRPLAALVANWHIAGDRRPSVVEVSWPANSTQTVSLTPLPGNVTRINGWVMVLRDITHLKHLEDLKMQVLTDMAGKIQAPLAQAMNTLAELESTQSASNGRFKEIVHRLFSIWRRIQVWTDDLLALVRYESGVGVKSEDVQLSAVANQVASDLAQRPALRSKELKLDLHLTHDLPLVRADPDVLGKVLQGLLGRAAMRSSWGGAIRLMTYLMRGQVWLEISDDGPALSDTDLPHLFERSFAGPDASDDNTGLELALVKAIIDRAGGQVWVRGSTIALCLPAIGGDRSADRPAVLPQSATQP